MPGFEWIDKKELKAVKKIFYEGGTLIAHGFDKLRKKYYVTDFEKFSNKYFKSKNCLASCKKIIEKNDIRNETEIASRKVGAALIGNFLFLKEKLDILHFF